MVSDVNAIVAELEAVDVLAGLRASQARLAVHRVHRIARHHVDAEGRDGRLFVLPTDGAAHVVNGDGDGHEVAVVAEGSIVGEIALLRKRPHAFTVTAVTPVSGLMGGRAAFTQPLAIAPSWRSS